MRSLFTRILLLAPGLCAVSGCGGVLDPQGPVGEAERIILLNASAIMLAIVIPTIIATLAVAWWFRASNTRAIYRPDWEYSGRIELIVWAIPMMVILLLGGITWIGSYHLDPPAPIASARKPIRIEVVSLDWKWLFIYPDYGVASVNRIVAPVGTPVSFRLTSATVMNSFFVPQLGTQIYTMHGMATRLHLQADNKGSFPGLSAQFSGDGFSGMRFSYDSVDQAAFETWLTQARVSGEVLDARNYKLLTGKSSYVPPYTYRAVRPGLFDAIVDDMAEPAPGHQTPPSSSHLKPLES
ncbi:ubiquinol oxidase subunit II [Novosphingobium sp. AP12]|uniref:ubiquinol oxidase subunit II n=1 Tax=Novosphingobium sp. AP12 TaxID=1144305 RepID=UPI000271E712|nr:ubiquinol oxidase subunit II [Novosphingobium sp. AP12]EJL33419.1 cytochrome o ubiquinol oxidase subunit II [Novosphingobium sp. AP12]